MRKHFVMGLMLLFWLLLMVHIIWQGTQGQWYVDDAKKMESLEVAKYTNQIMIVSVNKEGARLCFFVKKSNGEWEMILETEACIGENGLGKRKEGDRKTPIGVYRFTEAFGLLENPGSKINYTQVNENDYWVDDERSKYYNQFISTENIQQDWTSAERICEYGEVYHYVLATSYNIEKIPGVGSAVFLHCATEDMESTAGCVAVPEFYMGQIMKLVEPQCVLIIDTVENILKY